MYGAAGVNASLAHEPLCLNIICSSEGQALQEFAENWAKSATTVRLHFYRAHPPSVAAGVENDLSGAAADPMP
jgi:hypothetical protein